MTTLEIYTQYYTKPKELHTLLSCGIIQNDIHRVKSSISLQTARFIEENYKALPNKVYRLDFNITTEKREKCKKWPSSNSSV